MQCPECQKGELRPIHGNLACNRFPVCRHRESLPTVKKNPSELTYVVFDFETSGRSREDKIIEIGACKVQGGQIVDEFEALINPGKYINMVITDITGITNFDLMDKPKEDEVIPKFMEWLSDVQLMVAHNLSFDARFLKAACLRLGLPLFGGQGADTLAMARKALPGQSHKLGDLCASLGVSLNGAHRAINDVRATQQAFEMLKTYPDVYEPKEFGQFCKK